MTATAHINCGCIRFDQFQLAVEGRYFLALGTSTFTLHNSFASFNAQVVGSADVRVKLTLSPTGSSLPPPSFLKELESQNSCHQAPSAGRRSHTRRRVCFTPGTKSAIAAKPTTALAYFCHSAPSRESTAARECVHVAPKKGAPSSSSFVLENPDISPSNRRKEIVAGKSGSFPAAEAH